MFPRLIIVFYKILHNTTSTSLGYALQFATQLGVKVFVGVGVLRLGQVSRSVQIDVAILGRAAAGSPAAARGSTSTPTGRVPQPTNQSSFRFSTSEFNPFVNRCAFISLPTWTTFYISVITTHQTQPWDGLQYRQTIRGIRGSLGGGWTCPISADRGPPCSPALLSQHQQTLQSNTDHN